MQEYRRNGLHTLKEANAYEAEKKRRDSEMSLKKQRESASYLFPERSRERGSKWLNRDKEDVSVLSRDSFLFSRY
jgi:transcriptional adapter 2-alpha